jgi:hypothetical protein
MLLSTHVFKFNLRRYILAPLLHQPVNVLEIGVRVGRCRMTVSKPGLKAPVVSALET